MKLVSYLVKSTFTADGIASEIRLDSI